MKILSNKMDLVYKLVWVAAFVLLVINTWLIISLQSESYENDIATLPEKVILDKPVVLTGNKSHEEIAVNTGSLSLLGNNSIELDINLNGLCINDGQAGSMSLLQNGISARLDLSDYVKNCTKGVQKSIIPLSAFENLNPSLTVNGIEFSFWHPFEFKVEISDITVRNLSENILGAYTRNKEEDEKKKVPPKPIRPFPYLKFDN